MRKVLALVLMLSPLGVLGADLGKINVDTNISSEGISLGLDDQGVYSIAVTNEGYSFSFDDSDNNVSLGAYGVSLSTSDSKNIGVGYGLGIGFFDGDVHYNHMNNGDHVVGGATTLTVGGVGLETSLDWNVSGRKIDGKAGSSIDLWGATGSVVSNWDVKNFSYKGLDLSAGYSIPVSDGLSITPVASMGIDDSWARSDLKVGLSLGISFGGKNGNL